ncbi:Cytochrome c oxidase subunit 13, mitochondrial [Lithohypha guttulata]|nr:Cytochrome c oxidase subunit 13, mitochondrial [Lithohypha guttulata]
MSFHRLGLRMAQQALRRQTPTPAFRSFVRRLSLEEMPGGSKKLVGTADNAFNRERAAVKAHAAATSGLWRRLSIYVVIPCLILASLNAWNLWSEHWEHWEHLPPLEERVEYPYQNIRTKNYFFGDGDKTLFWNDKVNYHNKDKVT